MSKQKTTGASNAPEETAAAAGEATYTVAEFAGAAEKVFGAGITPDVVTAALLTHGITATTVAEAKKIVKAFAEKEVE